MNNFSKRFSTSVILIFILYFSSKSNLILIIVLSIVGFFSLIELFQLFQKIFLEKKNKILIFNYISITYIFLIFTQLFFFITKDTNNYIIFIFLLSTCVSTDVGGYVFGKSFRGKKLTKISPNKTYSGLIGSYICSLIVFLYFCFELDFSIKFLIITFFVCSISQLGDLFISYLKRKSKVKNTGKILPGHGGVLDRIDGMIFGIPAGINLTYLFL